MEFSGADVALAAIPVFVSLFFSLVVVGFSLIIFDKMTWLSIDSKGDQGSH